MEESEFALNPRAYSPIVCIVLGRLIFLSEVQLKKAAVPMLETPSGIITDDSDVSFAKAPAPIFFTVVGSDTLSSAVSY